MKKYFLCGLIIFLNALAINAQVQTLGAGAINKKDIGIANNKAIINSDVQEAANTWIEIYELPNYQGRMVRFNKSTDVLNLPFTPDRISIKRGNFLTTKVTISVASTQRAEDIIVKNDMPNERIGNYGLTGIRFEALPWIEIFEKPNQQGRSVKFVEDIFYTENLGLPFPTNNISVKLANDNVVATLSFDCAGRKNYFLVDKTKTNPNVSGSVCGLHIGKKGAMRLRFNGILTEIHNNDCKKMYGTIRYRVIEKDVNGNIVGVCKTIKATDSDQWGNVTVFNVPKNAAAIPTNLYDVNKFYIQERDARISPRLPDVFRSPDNSDTYILHYFDSAALKQNRLFLEVTTNIGSQHKGCDLCNDYTDNATMTRDVVKLIPIRLGYAQLQTGKFRSASGEGGFTGPEHATYLDFTFTSVSYNYYRELFPN